MLQDNLLNAEDNKEDHSRGVGFWVFFREEQRVVKLHWVLVVTNLVPRQLRRTQETAR
jgi:hypothetical protein